MTRVLVVEDLDITREQLTRYLEDGGLTVVGTAGTGEEAVEKVIEYEPDVVTMDVRMPGMDGIEATERIMAEHPTPVVMVSQYTREGADTTLSALEAGAVDHFHKLGVDPSIDINEYKTKLIETVEQAAEMRPEPLAPENGAESEAGALSGVEVTPGADGAAATGRGAVDDPSVAKERAGAPFLVVASSKGGVEILRRYLGGIPREIGLRGVVVQHLEAGFTEQFAARLDEHTDYTVTESVDGGTIAPGEIVVAHGGAHLEVVADDGERATYRHATEPSDLPVQPAADVTMGSAAEHVRGPLVGAVLTGLGNDGTEGARAIVDAGGSVVAQSADSSPADWMPRHVRNEGLAHYVFDAHRLGEAIVEGIYEAADVT